MTLVKLKRNFFKNYICFCFFISYYKKNLENKKINFEKEFKPKFVIFDMDIPNEK